jgi:heme oxygenase (biliverdin-IX-beta and delta-forming)
MSRVPARIGRARSSSSLLFQDRASPGSGARNVLKQQTAAAHRALDDCFGFAAQPDGSAYRRFLLMHARILPGLETLLRAAGHLDTVPDIACRWRTPALFADLTALELPPPEGISTSFDNSRASHAGLMYVLEGSTLGAGVIARQLRVALGEAVPLAFVSRRHAGRMWSGFVGWLDAAPWSAGELRVMAQSASALFDAYHAAARLAAPSLDRD